MNSEVIVPFLKGIELTLRSIQPEPPALQKVRYVLYLYGVIVESPVTSEDYERERVGSRLLLVEIIRRTAYDWVLYKNSRRLDQKQLAHEAYVWLFEEDEASSTWILRKKEGRTITSFVAICQILDVNIENLRSHIKKLTADKVVASGRFTTNNTASSPDKELHVHTTLALGSDLDFDGFEVGLE